MAERGRREWKATPLKSLVDRATRPAQKKRGFSEQRILTEWPHIVGNTIAENSQPLKIAFDPHGNHGSTLHLMVNPSWAMEVQYMEAMIVEKVARFFGYRAIERITIMQSPVNYTRKKQAELKQSTQQLSQKTKELTESIEDDSLREALKKLGIAREE